MSTQKTLSELQSQGISMLEAKIFQESTISQLYNWSKNIISISAKFSDNFAFQDNCVYMPEMCSFSLIRRVGKLKGWHRFPSSGYDSIISRRKESDAGGLFIDIIGLNSFREILIHELQKSDLFRGLQHIYGISSNDVELHVYYTSNYTQPRGWHLDGPTLKLFTYLTDVDKRHGPYAYQINSHKYYCDSLDTNRSINVTEIKDDICRENLNIDDMRICKGKAGTSFISDQTGIHRGFPQVKGYERYMFVTQIYLV